LDNSTKVKQIVEYILEKDNSKIERIYEVHKAVEDLQTIEDRNVVSKATFVSGPNSLSYQTRPNTTKMHGRSRSMAKHFQTQ